MFKKPPLNPLKHLSASLENPIVSNLQSPSASAVSYPNDEELSYDPIPLFSYMREQLVDLDGDVFAVYTRTVEEPVAWFLFHHGAGHSAATWALTFQQIDELARGRFSLLAYDCRGHGKTITRNDSDLSLNSLKDDCVRVVNHVMNHGMPGSRKLCLVGHSMGGPVVVEAAKLLSSVHGVVVLDVVEGTAMESISYMESVIASTPASFTLVQDAIKWHLDNHKLHNVTSARISIPYQLIQQKGHFVPRVKLAESEKYWVGWFTGLSKKFLSVGAPKLLVVAGTDRLDRDLMIAQMQGKFEYRVLPGTMTGHCIQEDAPGATASLLIQFWDRNSRKPSVKTAN